MTVGQDNAKMTVTKLKVTMPFSLVKHHNGEHCHDGPVLLSTQWLKARLNLRGAFKLKEALILTFYLHDFVRIYTSVPSSSSSSSSPEAAGKAGAIRIRMCYNSEPAQAQ